MSSVGAQDGLGVFVRDWTRSVVVLSDDGELAVALRDCVDPARALIRDARPAECDRALAACRPWPWMVVGTGETAPRELLVAAAQRPMVTLWYGGTPPGLPEHARAAGRFGELARMVNAALQQTVGGMRLGPGLGVEMPGGRRVRSAALEALIALHPRGFDMPLRVFRSATRALQGAGVPLRPETDPDAGGVVLAPMHAARTGAFA